MNLLRNDASISHITTKERPNVVSVRPMLRSSNNKQANVSMQLRGGNLGRRKKKIENVATPHFPRGLTVAKESEGEYVAAGWPPWLASVAGEAIKGWIPRRADSFEKLDKDIAPHLGKGSSVIFITSIAGFQPQGSMAMYGVTKTALLGLTRHLLLKWLQRHT